MKRTISNIFCGAALLLATSAGSSCDDWTENEKIAVENPVFGEDDPGLYARYLASLRAYKNGDHYRTVVWFDNSDKRPVSRGGFFLRCARQRGCRGADGRRTPYGRGTRTGRNAS